MSKAGTLIILALSFAGVVAACGGKVVFVAQGHGGAGGAASASVAGPSVATNGVGTCMTCDCMPGGCGAGGDIGTSGVGGGSSGNCAMKCADVLTSNGGLDLCANAPASASDAFDALGQCICGPAACAEPCKLTCAMMDETNPDCADCEVKSLSGPCSTQAATCAMN